MYQVDPNSHHKTPPTPAAPKPKRRGWTKQQKERMTDEQIYSRLRDEYLAENPVCARPGCVKSSTQVHHIVRGDAGKARSRLNQNTWLEVCSDECHEFIASLHPDLQAMIKQNAVRATIERLRR